MSRRYDRREVEEILRRAVGREVGEEGLAHEDLVAAAAEVGVSPEAVAQAAAELEHDRERAALLVRVTRRRRQRFFRRCLSFLGLGGLLFAIDAVTPGGSWWFWPVIGLAFPMLRMGLKTFLPSEGELERAVEEEARRQESKRTRRERRARRRAERERKRGDSARREAQFEQIMERAVDALLHAADKKLGQLDRRDSQTPRSAPGVRVDPTVADDRSETPGERERSRSRR